MLLYIVGLGAGVLIRQRKGCLQFGSGNAASLITSRTLASTVPVLRSCGFTKGEDRS
jgi:hypothetical protein